MKEQHPPTPARLACYGCGAPLGRRGDPPGELTELPRVGRKYIHRRESCYDRAIGHYVKERNDGS